MIFLHSILFVDAGKAFEGLFVAVTANQMMFEHIGCATRRTTPTQAILMRTDHQRQLWNGRAMRAACSDWTIRSAISASRQGMSVRVTTSQTSYSKRNAERQKKQLLYRVTEFASALGIKQRTGQLTESQAKATGMVTLDAVLANNAKRHKLRPVAV